MTRFTEPGLRGCAGLSLGLVSSLLIPGAALAVPIQAPGAASAAAPNGTAAVSPGPRRPGLIPSSSPRPGSGLASDPSSSPPRRPVPGQNRALSASQ